MKRVLSIVLCLMLVGSLFTLALSASAAEEDNAVGIAADQTIAENGIDGGDPLPTEEPTFSDETINDETTAVETVSGETSAETTTETIAPTSAATTAATTAATEAAAATKDQKKASPKTGENMWLWIGIGIFAVALIAIIATVIAKKKAK